jgi:hypothetical protein
MRFEVSGEVLATFREAMVKLRRDAGGSLDDDAALLQMARQGLGGPTDCGRASYQVAVTHVGGGTHVGAETSGDGQRPIGSRRERASQTIPPAPS